jgi:5-methylcytosine-specific restriction endonuclease McrA
MDKQLFLNKIKEIYLKCPVGYHVDHIIPLQGEKVCGLHVEWNLQYLTPSANHSKSNKLIC